LQTSHQGGVKHSVSVASSCHLNHHRRISARRRGSWLDKTFDLVGWIEARSNRLVGMVVVEGGPHSRRCSGPSLQGGVIPGIPEGRRCRKSSLMGLEKRNKLTF
jgi:hypothetical protein